VEVPLQQALFPVHCEVHTRFEPGRVRPCQTEMEAISSSEMSVLTRDTRRHIQEITIFEYIVTSRSGFMGAVFTFRVGNNLHAFFALMNEVELCLCSILPSVCICYNSAMNIFRLSLGTFTESFR
jgi:hypothetical protein